MELNDLKKYLGMIVDLEKNIYLQNNLIEKLESRISKLGFKKTYNEPNEPEISRVGFILVVTLVGIICGSLMLSAGFKRMYIDSRRMELFSVVVLLLLGGIFSLLSVAVGLPSFLTILEKNKKETRRYRDSMQEYKLNVEADKVRVERELEEKTVLSHELETLSKKNAESDSILNKLYSSEIVFPKYRNLVMMCSIYEYLCSGRCTTLEGHEGAYNILEMEIRLDRIIVQLDRVLSSLAQIQANQYMLYDAIQENNRIEGQILESTNQIISSINRNSKEIKSVMESIDKNSAVAAYAAERSQKELEFMNTMNYFQSKYQFT